MTGKYLVACRNELIMVAVGSLLKGQADLEVLEVRINGEEDLIEVINRYQPDVVVLDGMIPEVEEKQLLPYLIRFPKIGVLIVDLKDNIVSVYREHLVQVSQLSDLMPCFRDARPDP